MLSIYVFVYSYFMMTWEYVPLFTVFYGNLVAVAIILLRDS